MGHSGYTGNVNGKSVAIIEISKEETLDTYAKIEFTVLADSINLIDIRNSSFIIYLNNDFFASGIVLNRPSLSFDEGKNVAKLSGISELGRLSCDRAYSLGYYQDTLITSILADLLSKGSFSFLLDATNFSEAGTAKTTIDLRTKETLFSQISETIKTYPNLHMREVYDVNGNGVLEIGEFDDVLFQATKGYNIIGMSLEQNQTRVYKKIESYSGHSPDIRLSLNDSLSDGRAQASSFYTQFPIIVDGDGLAYVENTGTSSGCSSVKDFDLHKTNNDSVIVQQDKDDASFALYQKTVRFLQNTDDAQNYTISMLSNLGELTVGDRIRVVSEIREQYRNPTNMMLESIQVLDVNDDFRITRIKSKLDQVDLYRQNGVVVGQQYLHEIRVTNSEDISDYDSEVELYERLNKPNELPSFDAINISVPVGISVVHDENIDATDASLTDLTLAKEYTFDVATGAPVWATGKTMFISSIVPSQVKYEISQNVSTDLSDIIIKVSGVSPEFNWGVGVDLEEITVNIAVLYSQ